MTEERKAEPVVIAFKHRTCPTLFRSAAGLVMNRYGIVFDGASVVCDAVNGAVKREALAAGWRRVEGVDAHDVGRTWEKPEPADIVRPAPRA